MLYTMKAFLQVGFSYCSSIKTFFSGDPYACVFFGIAIDRP